MTDGRFSGTNLGLAVGHVAPEAMADGPIALLNNGDMIVIDIPSRTLKVNVSETEMAHRRKEWKKPEPRVKKGILGEWALRGGSLARGGALGK